jgi:putative lipoprotein (rSAM/lipoprotein system)
MLKRISLFLTTFLINSGCTRVLYGPSAAKYNVDFSGKVKSEKTTEPIANILVLLKRVQIHPDTIIGPGIDYTYSDENGDYSLEAKHDGSTTFMLSFSDIDSTENGSYAERDTLIEITGENDTAKTIDIELDEIN